MLRLIPEGAPACASVGNNRGMTVPPETEIYLRFITDCIEDQAGIYSWV